MANDSTNDILRKYGKQLENESGVSYADTPSPAGFSDEFKQFKSDMMPNFSRYERWCTNLGGVIKVKLAIKDKDAIQKQLDSAHIDTLPSQVVGLAIMAFSLFFILGALFTTAIALFTGVFSFLLLFLFIITAFFLAYYFFTMPQRLANEWRLKAGSQMVPCILYTVVYMKHTSNLERAIRFASQHLEPPLSFDLGKVFWDVETGKFSSMKESLDYYLESWRGTNTEFIESFNLIESSLFEPTEARRIQILERALQVILEGVYDKMLKYSHSVKAPLTNLYMLGIVLPTLGLALIPLASALVGGAIKWYHVVVIFNLIVPFMVFYMTNEVMTKRPGGYGESSILELNPLYPKYKSKKPYWIAAAICIPLFLIGIVPFLFNYTPLPGWLNLQSDYTFQEIGFGALGNMKIFDFVEGAGPMGTLSLILSMFIPLSLFLFFSIAYFGKTKQIIKSRDYSKILEAEFNNSLFQLGNRIGDGTPAELAFGRVAQSAKGQVTEEFFRRVNSNIQSLGMSLEKAIFDPKRGAIIEYPSNLIATSMHILIESVKKGLQVAAQSLMSIADYIRNINKINERLRDLLADITSDMSSNMTFLAPLLAGIVVGLSSMITLILSKLSVIVNQAIATGTDLSQYGNLINIVDLFKVDSMIPPYYLQICVGIYILEIIFILTKTLVTVDSGQDKLKETYEIAKNLRAGGLLYLIIAFLSVIGLSFVASVALGSLTI
jgi:hypothetical protein